MTEQTPLQFLSNSMKGAPFILALFALAGSLACNAFSSLRASNNDPIFYLATGGPSYVIDGRLDDYNALKKTDALTAVMEQPHAAVGNRLIGQDGRYFRNENLITCAFSIVVLLP